MRTQDLDLLFAALVDFGVATEEEIILVSNINGHKLETYENILFARTEWRSFEQWAELGEEELSSYGFAGLEDDE